MSWKFCFKYFLIFRTALVSYVLAPKLWTLLIFNVVLFQNWIPISLNLLSRYIFSLFPKITLKYPLHCLLFFFHAQTGSETVLLSVLKSAVKRNLYDLVLSSSHIGMFLNFLQSRKLQRYLMNCNSLLLKLECFTFKSN